MRGKLAVEVPGGGGVVREAVGLQIDGVPSVGVRQIKDEHLYFVASVRCSKGQPRIDDVGGGDAVARIGEKIRLLHACVVQLTPIKQRFDVQSLDVVRNLLLT